MFDPFTILAALIPTIKYGVERVIDYNTGGPKPSNAKEAIEINDAEARKLEALSKLDNSEGAAQWVINIRALQRPIAVLVILTMWSLYAVQSGISAQDMQNMASAAIFYLFGDRTTMFLSEKNKRR